ncbi:MAG TPA: ABC transporter substrate-binding protein [Anaeromyxobacteraceae bacterium]|jgi:NitT/TauT family transport system substrate-binding protein|nr:ABC transporter substrate-binding protein [Anaeromyxobacteraceae bacterium]
MKKLLALVALALATAGPAAAADLVRLGNLKFAHYGAVSYMKELAPRYGLRIEERIFPKGVDIIPGILAGEVDLAASAADAAVAGRAAGAPVVAVAGFAKGGARIVVRADLGLKRVEDLKGRKVGVPRGGAQEILLLAELGQHGLTWSDQPGKADVTILYLAYADLNQALMAKQIDAMSQSEPQSTQAIAKGFGVELLKPYDTPLGEPVRVLVMTEKLYRNRDLALRVMKCFVDATRSFLADRALAEKYVRENLFKGQLGARDYEDAMQNAAFTYDLTVEHLQRTTDLMKKYGVGKLRQPPPAADWVKLDLLQEAKQQLGVK